MRTLDGNLYQLGIEEDREVELFFREDKVYSVSILESEEGNTIMANIGGIEYPLIYTKDLWEHLRAKISSF